MTCVLCLCSDSLERRLGEVQQECEGLKQELAIASAARDAAELALKTEQSTSQKLQKDCDELKQTCEDYTGEINSLLRDLTDHANTIKTLEEKRGALQQQVSEDFSLAVFMMRASNPRTYALYVST